MLVNKKSYCILLVDRVSTLMERLVPLNEVFLHNSQPFLNLVYVYPEKENVWIFLKNLKKKNPNKLLKKTWKFVGKA